MTQSNNQTAHRLLVLHDDSDGYFNLIQEKFPQLPLALCNQTAQVMETVATFQPTIIYSWKSKAISHEVQKQALAFPSVEWVQIGGAGFDHLLPLEGATAVFTNTSGVLADSMAETVMGALLMLNFGFPKAIRQQQTHQWQPFTFPPVAGKTAVIVGLGHIGKKVALRAKQFGMTVIGIRNCKTAVENVDQLLSPAQLYDALPQADFLCLHVPHTPATHHMIDAKAFDLMPSTSILINTARGGVVDETALLDALQNQQIAAAYSDVFAEEPLPENSPLWNAPNLVISPHMADTIDKWESAYTHFFCQNLERWLENKPLKNIVDIKRGY